MAEAKQKVAIIMSDRMGDSLIGMVTANNLQRNQRDVTVYSLFIDMLKPWFPDFKIKRDFTQDDLSCFDRIYVLFDRDYVADLKKKYKTVTVMSDASVYKSKQSMVDIQVDYCLNHIRLNDVVRENGITPINTERFRIKKKQVAIHPTSADDFKIWPKEKFIVLANYLVKLGYHPVFVVAPNELSDWASVRTNQIEVISLPNLSDVAEIIYQSNYFVGCDSGLGHLASCLKIPTLSICIRKGTARMWAPAWYLNIPVLAPAWLFCRPLKDRFWKTALSVDKIVSKFKKLVRLNHV